MKMVNLRRPPVGVNLQGASYFGGMADVNDHVARVAAGGGTGANESDLFKIYRFLHSQGLLSGTRLLWTPEAGYVQRVDGVLKYCRSGFDVSLFENDLDGSATASQQPRLVGGIAPGSKVAASNQTGDSRKFTHATITVTGTYTVVKMLNTTGKYANAYTEVVGGTITECTWTGGMRLYMVYAGVLSAGQRALIDAFMYTLYQEIETVTIGSQVWASRNFEAVATPMGNVIANVTENGAVEKNADSGFDTTDGWNIPYPSILGISSSKLNYTGSTNSMYVNRLATFTAGKYYKISINVLSGTARIGLYGTSSFIIPIKNYTAGTTTLITKALVSGNNLNIFAYNNSGGTAFEVESLSVQELNWSNATEIYDAVYAATSGTTAQKEYAALKEAADWVYHSNSVNNGAIFGKIYNGYGKLLLVKDIASSTGWGYHVATEAELTTLATNGGYALKYGGTDYWTTTGGTNTTGFTALGGGTRSDVDGSFSTIKDTTAFWCANSDKVLLLNHADNTAIITAVDKAYGAYIRLVKD